MPFSVHVQPRAFRTEVARITSWPGSPRGEDGRSKRNFTAERSRARRRVGDQIVAIVLCTGRDAELLEGVSQTLAGVGHIAVVAHDISEALDLLEGVHPLVVVVSCDELMERTGVYHATLAQGGALIAYHCDDDDEPDLPFSVKRTILARLSLPLERQRLLTLVKSVENRAHASGKKVPQTAQMESGMTQMPPGRESDVPENHRGRD